MFHPDWCEKVEEESVNFVQREGDVIPIEATLSTNANFTTGSQPFKIDPNSHITGLDFTTAKSPYEPLKVYPTEPPLHEARANFADGSKSFSVEGKLDKVIDWEQRKWDASVAAMQGMLAHPTRYKPRECDKDVHWHIAMCREASDLADEMIKQLKEQ